MRREEAQFLVEAHRAKNEVVPATYKYLYPSILPAELAQICAKFTCHLGRK